MLAYLLMTLVLLNVKNQVLRKLVKHLNSENVNRCYTNDFKHFPFSWKVLFLFWLRVWLRRKRPITRYIENLQSRKRPITRYIENLQSHSTLEILFFIYNLLAQFLTMANKLLELLFLRKTLHLATSPKDR